MLTMAGVWSLLRLPGASLQMVSFAFLTSSMLFDVQSFSLKLRRVGFMAAGAALVGFSMGVTADLPLLRIILSALLSFFILAASPDRQTAIIILLTGYLTLFSASGFQVSLNRCADIFFAAAVTLVVTGVVNLFLGGGNSVPAGKPYSLRHAAIITAELTCCFIISLVFRHEQNAWLMLTVLFIHLAKTPAGLLKKLAEQRIAAVPLGIVPAGILLASLCSTDYRWIYITPFTATLGFFILYRKGDFFYFTILFMFSLTVLTDWLTGTGNRFNFVGLLLSRSIATVIGVVILQCGAFLMKEESELL